MGQIAPGGGGATNPLLCFTSRGGEGAGQVNQPEGPLPTGGGGGVGRFRPTRGGPTARGGVNFMGGGGLGLRFLCSVADGDPPPRKET